MRKIICLIGLILFVFMACKQNDALEYEDDPALYFFYDKYGQADSIAHSFFFLPDEVSRDTVYVDIRTMGNLSEKDRPISIVQTNTGAENAAVAGVHYIPFDDAEVKKYFIVAAGKAAVKIPIIFLKDASLSLKEVRLALAVEKNDFFRPGISTQSSFLLKTTSQAVKPKNWDNNWKYLFGASWGAVKMKFIIDHTGYTNWDDYPIDSGYKNYLSSKVINAFNQYNLENPDNPLCEADGTPVVFR